MSLAGGCFCGAVRYTLDYPGIPAIYACHCLNCQTMTGGGFVMQAPVPLARLSITGERTAWTRTKASGDLTTHHLCATCRTRLYGTSASRPGTALLRAGTLDDSARVVPVVHMWTARQLPWIALPPEAERYDEAVPPERMMTLFAPNFA